MARPVPSPELLDRLLDTIELDIVPLTQAEVVKGNKIFGAALLHKSDLSLLLAETNNEQESPLWHGEMHALKRYHEMPVDSRPAPEELVFLSTHEPCSLCMSAITWAGFDNFFYFFSHEDSRDAFAIPHDLKILKEVFDVEPGGYSHSNDFWDSYNLKKLAAEFSDDKNADNRTAKIDRIAKLYDAMSDTYQSDKGENAIPLK